VTYTQTDIAARLQNVRCEADGSASADCFVCEGEGHPGHRLKFFIGPDGTITGVACDRYAPAGIEINREHCRPVRDLLNLSPERRPAQVTRTLFDGDHQITLEAEHVSKQTQFLTVRNGCGVLFSNELRLTRMDERAAFVRDIPDLTPEERDTVGHELIQLLDDFRQVRKAADEAPDEDEGRKSAATQLIAIASAAVLFHDPDGDGYAMLEIAGHKEVWPLKSKGFKRWLAREYFTQTGKAAPSQSMGDALGVLEGKSNWDGPERQVFTRIAEKDGKIYLDLCDEQFRAVEIDKSGWRVVAVPPVDFRRSKGQLALPEPERGGKATDLLPFLNIAKEDWILIAADIVASLRWSGPFPILVLNGGQGSAKSTTARVVISLTDPHSTPLRSEPREERDFVISVKNRWNTALDNMSRIPQWLSDSMCRISTGGGLSLRQLYSDDDEVHFSVMRPLTLTSIEELATKPDLLERSLVVNLPRIEDTARMEEREFWPAFEKARPRILGAFLDAVSSALRNLDKVKLLKKPRMADFAVWSTAAEEALGGETGSFMRAYLRNCSKATDIALEASPVAEALSAFAEFNAVNTPWEGTAKELYARLEEGIDEAERRRRKDQKWPATPKGLSGALRQLEPSLRTRGIILTFDLPRTDKKGSRKLKIEKTSQPSPEPENPAEDGKKKDRENASEPSDRQNEPQAVCSQSESSDAFSDASSDDPEADAFFTEFDRLASQASDASYEFTDDPLTHFAETTVRKEPAEPEEFAAEKSVSDGSDAFFRDLISLENTEFISLDTEVTGFDRKAGAGYSFHTARSVRMLGLSASADGKAAGYTEDPETWQRVLSGPGQRSIFFNAHFDLAVLKSQNLTPPESWEDVAIVHRLLNEEGAHDLKSLEVSLLGLPERPGYEQSWRERMINPDGWAEYAAMDARSTFRLWQLLEPQLRDQGLLKIYQLEKLLLPVVMEMEETGMLIDVKALQQAEKEFRSQLARIKSDIFSLTGNRFNLSAHDSLAKILQKQFGLKLELTTEGGKPSVSAEALEALAGQHPIIPLLLEHRSIEKLARDFIKKLPGLTDKQGRIHASYNPLGAVSGRFTANHPNTQQMPRSSGPAQVLRKAFIAAPGHRLVVADWSQVELRILAHFTGDNGLCEAFAQDADLHRRAAAKMFHKSDETVSPQERTIAKTINFGLSYGMGAPGLFKGLNAKGLKVTMGECRSFIQAWNRSYPGVKNFFDELGRTARRQGYVTTFAGRRRRMNADGSNELSVKNSVIQGTGADLLKRSMVRLYGALPEGARMICCVHDEIVTECREEQAEEVRALMVEIMQSAPEGFTVPLKVDAKIAGNWGEAK